MKINLNTLLNANDLKETLANAGKSAAGTALQKVMAKDQVQTLMAQQAEKQAITAAGEQALSFWTKYKKEIIITSVVVGGVGAMTLGWLIYKAFKNK